MSSPDIWSLGRYDAVGVRIAHIAERVVDAAARRRALRDAAVVDLACGTGSAAIAAAARGARVTGVDITPELIAQAAGRSGDVDWRVGDAADTGLPGASFDAVVSNMGIIFVEPERLLTEVARLSKPGAVFAFSAWVWAEDNPLFDPLVTVLGPPARTGFSPDQWGDEGIVAERLAPYVDDVAVDRGEHRWEFASVDEGMHWLRAESPMHVATFQRVGDAAEELTSAFTEALQRHAGPSGAVAFDSPYAVVSAVYRAS